MARRGRRASFQVRFWGVRGSYPTSARNTLKVGGHTACVEARVGGDHLIFDAGTGIIPLGIGLINQRTAAPLNLFLSHTHHDHIFGLYFFEPLHDSKKRLSIFGPDGNRSPLRKTLRTAMNQNFFPVGFDELKGCKGVYSLKGGESIRLKGAGRPRIRQGQARNDVKGGEVSILAHKSAAHPNGVILYRVNFRGKSFVYATDIEEPRGGDSDVIEFVRGADILIHDAQYLAAEYGSRAKPRIGWGHSTVEAAAATARNAGVKRLILFHHEPNHGDHAIKVMENQARKHFPASVAAREGMTLNLL